MSAAVSPLYRAVPDGSPIRPLGSYLTAGSKAELVAFLGAMGLVPASRIGVNQWGHAIAGLHSEAERQKALDLGAVPKNWDAYNQLAMS